MTRMTSKFAPLGIHSVEQPYPPTQVNIFVGPAIFLTLKTVYGHSIATARFEVHTINFMK